MTEPTPFPASPYCQVRARVASIWADGPDDGAHPDWRPAVGEKVVLTSSIGSQLLTYDVGGADPIIVTVERVDCVVGDDGLLTKSDGRPVYIASTDDPLLSVTGWTWTASIKGKSVTFAAPTGVVVDLALFIAAPATNDTKTWVERIPELKKSLVSIASITSDADDMVVNLTDGESHRFPMPPGTPGHTPVVGLDGDRLTVDGVPVGGSLRGPAGAPGGPGAIATQSTYLIVGPGRPDAPSTTGGIITGKEPTGAEYRSTDGAGVGAWVWVKRGTGAGIWAQWTVTYGDTGFRGLDIRTAWPEYYLDARLLMRRVGDTVTVTPTNASFSVGDGVANTGAVSYEIETGGFQPESTIIADIYDPYSADFGAKVGTARVRSAMWKTAFTLRHDALNNMSFELRWTTDQRWPDILPGYPG